MVSQDLILPKNDTKKAPFRMLFPLKIGAGDGTQTRDLMITNQLLYQLSYTGFARFFNRKRKYYKIRRISASSADKK